MIVKLLLKDTVPTPGRFLMTLQFTGIWFSTLEREKNEYPEMRCFPFVAAIFIFTLELFLMLYDVRTQGAFQNSCTTFQWFF